MDKPTITVIGLGNAGTAFLKIFTDCGFKIVSVFSRSIDDHVAKKFPDINFNTGSPYIDAFGDMIFLTVPDDAIESLTNQIASQSEDLSRKKFIHCSGALTSEVLKPLKHKGASIASFHPIASITAHTESFDNIWFDLEGDDSLVHELEKMAADMGAYTLKVKAEHKVLLHAAAVSASNYLVVLANLTADIAAQTGISADKAMQAFTPLMKSSIANIEQLGPVHALTGPVARGDIDTIKMHIRSLESFPEIVSLYKIMGRSAVEIARSKSGDTEALREILKLLS